MPIPERKYCKKCGKVKPSSEFRIRTEKRTLPHLEYLNYQCRTCEAEYSKRYHHDRKDDQEYMKKNAERVRLYDKRTGASKKRWQKRKNDVEFKKKIAEYRKLNSKRIKANQRKRSLKHHTINRDQITDAYCIARLKSQFKGITNEFIISNPDLIEIKRNEILIFRVKQLLIKESR